ITGRAVEEWIGAKNDLEMLTMPAKAPCVEVTKAVEAHAKTVRMARLIAELAATTSQMRDKDKKDEEKNADAAGVAADTTERGWIVRATIVVRNVLKRLAEREAAAKLAAARAAEAKAARVAAAKAMRLASNDQDDRTSGKPVRRYEVRSFTP